MTENRGHDLLSRVPLAVHAGSLALDLVPLVLAFVVAWILERRLLGGSAVLMATVGAVLLFVVVACMQWRAISRRRATWGMRVLRVDLGDARGGRHWQVRLGVRSAYFGVVSVALFVESVARSVTTDGRIPGMGLLGLVVLVDTFTLALSRNRIALHDIVLGFETRWSGGGANGCAITRPERPGSPRRAVGSHPDASPEIPGFAVEAGRSAPTAVRLSAMALVVVPAMVAGGLGGYFGQGWLVAAGLVWLLLGILVARVAGAGR